MNIIKELFIKVKNVRRRIQKDIRLKKYFANNRVPWSEGYEDYKWDRIGEIINDASLLHKFQEKKPLPEHYGSGLDERIVEYPYVFSHLSDSGSRILDAGSTFNFASVITHPIFSKKELTIYTAYPERQNFIGNKISYVFGDLRILPFRDEWFDEIACMSTLEHIGMDNAIYGYGEETIKKANALENTEYLKAVSELVRVLKSNGRLFLTVPFGQKINYGYFQQFDSRMIASLNSLLGEAGQTELIFFKYLSSGWQFSNEEECNKAEAFNPHTGQGKGTDGAAHSRAICGIQLTKK